MRVVIYDEETLEPITVINLKGVTYRDIEALRQCYRVPVIPPVLARDAFADGKALVGCETQTVDLSFEPICRVRPDGRKQRSWLCFTKQEELALALVPGWLPGQKGAVEALIDAKERMEDFVMNMLSRYTPTFPKKDGIDD